MLLQAGCAICIDEASLVKDLLISSWLNNGEKTPARKTAFPTTEVGKQVNVWVLLAAKDDSTGTWISVEIG